MKILTGLPVSQYAVNKDFRTYLILIDSALKRKHIVVLEGIHEDKQQSCFLKGLSLHQGYKIIGIKKHHIVLRNVAENELVTKITFE